MYADNYVENDVLNAEPLEIVCLLYAKAIEKLKLALICLENGDIPGRSNAIGHAMEIIVELQGSLDPEQGGEISERLAELYGYLQERLSEANARQEAEPVREAVKLLSILYEGWQDCRPSRKLDEIPIETPSAAGEVLSQAWTV